MMLALLVFLATAVLTFGVMALVHSRGAVKRRAAGIADYSGESWPKASIRCGNRACKAVQRVLDYTSKHYSAGDKGDAKVLRRRLIQAGIFDPRAVAFFFVARTALAVGLAVAAFFVLPMVVEPSSSIFWLSVMAAGSLGYVAPSLYHRPADRAAPQRAPRGLSGFHGPAGGVRGFRAEHGGVARAGRARAWRIPIRRSAPTSTWPISKSAPAAP